MIIDELVRSLTTNELRALRVDYYAQLLEATQTRTRQELEALLDRIDIEINERRRDGR